MEPIKIRRLIDKALKGNKAALYELAEWGLDVLLEVHIDDGYLPLWARVRLKRQLQERRTAKAGRAVAVARRNIKRGEDVRAPIRAALVNVSLHNKKTDDLIRIVVSYLMRNGLERFGLSDCPCDETIERVIRELRGKKVTQ